ncbi:helix-turn-helix domain-containing protein [Lysobacter humi (ex Lee et al. 2017)]
MNAQERIRLARRHAGLSQSGLAKAVGVQRSAVSHWEAVDGKSPSMANLRRVATTTGVQFEWLATGRGRMALSADETLEDVAAADGTLIDDSLELRLIAAFRQISARSRAPLVELMEQMAELRSGKRARRPMP